MAQLLISRDISPDTPHEARTAADQQATIWDHAEILGRNHDYHPAVDLQTADLYIGTPTSD